MLSLDIAPGVERTEHWLVAADRWDTKLAYRGMYRSEGISPIWVAAQLRGADAPAAVHAHFGPLAAQLVPFARVLGQPLVASFYGYDATRALYVDGFWWRRRYRRLFNSAASFIVEGPRMRERVAALGCPDEKIQVVRLPADEKGLAHIKRRPASMFRVVVAGRFVEKKGFDTAIRAFARAFYRERDVELLIIGGGPLEGYYRSLARSSGIDDRISWEGRLEFTDFMARIATAHIALYPSRTATDGDSDGGAPVTIIEAQWLGVPSVVSRHDDLEFVAGPGAIALGADAVDDWAETLEFLFNAPGKLQEMSRTSKTFVRTRNSPLANARMRELVYDAART